MRKFLKKVIILFSLILFTYATLGFLADGYTDPFYLRFTSTKQNSLIIGTSRAAQGIRPNIIDSLVDNKKFDLPIYNFGFTIIHSPFGETYYNAINFKLKKTGNNGLFIVAVDPWAISKRTNLTYDIESKEQLSKLTYYNMNPNYDYLLNSLNKSMFSLVTDKFKEKSDMFLHDNGWLEVNFDMNIPDLQEILKFKIKTYESNRLIYKISNKRLNWLEKTVTLLSKYGKVVLVRIPVSKEILAIENKFCKNFDSIIMTNFSTLPYLNYKQFSTDYRYTDGNHLYKESGKKFTQLLANDINKLTNND